jgi:transcriptional regulator with XRE-family HTH domain
MDLKQIFVANLRRFRKERGISQFHLSDLCDTSLNYIAAIEIGRRFPSLKLIERIGQALQVEPYRFFIDASADGSEGLEETIGFLAKLPDKMKLNVIHRISFPLE